MRQQLGFCVLLAAGAAVVLGAASAGFKVAPDPENVVASRLAGRWEVDMALAKRMLGNAPGSAGKLAKTFEIDPKVVEMIPEKYAPHLNDRPIYLAGRMKVLAAAGPGVYPFILTTLHGNPHVLYFCEKDGDPMGDAESFNVMLARANDPANDILFVGGDFNNQPFTAYRRAAEPRPAQ